MLAKLFSILLGFNLFFLQSYLLRFSVGSYSGYVQEALLLLTFLIYFLWKGPSAILSGFFKHPVLAIFLALTGLSFLAVPLLDVGEAFRGLKFLFYAELLAFLFLEGYPTEKERWRGCSFLAYGALCFGLFSVIFNLLGYNVQHDFRLSGPLDSAVYLAFYLVPAVLFFAFSAFKKEGRSRSWMLFCFVLASLFLLATRSFGSLGATGLMFGVMLFSQKPVLKNIFLSAGLIFCIFLFWFKILPAFQTSYSSLNERGEIWQTAVALLHDPSTFFFGVGFGQFQAHYEQTVVAVLGREPLDYQVLQPHNLFLWFWMHFGFLGVIFVCYVFISILRGLLLRHELSGFQSYVLSVLLVFFIHGLIDTPFLKNDLLFLLILFMELVVGPSCILNKMKPFYFQGTVVHGMGRGRSLGAPTLNLKESPSGLSFGVYVGRVEIEQKKYSCILHWGPRPSFGEEKPVLEIHLLDAKMDLYGRSVDLEVLQKLREVQTFASPAALSHQIQKDLRRARAFFA